MSGDAEDAGAAGTVNAGELTREELLDNSPEAVAMRRVRAARVEAAAKVAVPVAAPKDRRATRRRLILGVALGGMGAAQLLSRLAAGSRGP